MIPIELLKQVKTIITHADCPDGSASALVLHDALPDAEIRFVNYGKPERENMKAEPGQLWCDMTPPEARVQEFVDAGAIVLDHHKGAEDLVRLFGDRGVFADEVRDPGVSGALLAYREVWAVLNPPMMNVEKTEVLPHPNEAAARDFATLAGIRDTWQKSSPRWREALAAYHALTLHDWEHWRALGRPWLTAEELKVGEALLKKRERDVEKTARDAWIGPVSVTLGAPEARTAMSEGRVPENNVEVARIALAIVNVGYELASDVSDWLRENQHVDLILAFRYEARGEDQVLRVSARSSERYDCAALAKALGGGGHTRAAGFEMRNAGEPFFLLMQIARDTPQPRSA